MCGVCAVTAAAGVTGLRAWLQTRPWTWLTRPRLRRLTIAATVVAFVIVAVAS